MTQPVFSLDDAVTETLFVETVVNRDRDGRRDLVRIHVSRPGETETEGIDVPVVFEHSPYRGEFGDAENHPVDFDVLPQGHVRPGHGGDRTEARRGWGRSRLRADLPGALDDRYVPRGYAVILGEGIGSAGSDGCPTIGDSDEALPTRAVIDWLNGRARAFDADGRSVRADWTTGAVGMTGVSYDGTLPNMVATTGVQGLRRSSRSARSRAGTTTTARTSSWRRRTPTRRAWARTSTSARTPTCSRGSPPATSAAPGRARTCCSGWPSSRTARPATTTGSGASATTCGAPATCVRASSSSTASTTGT